MEKIKHGISNEHTFWDQVATKQRHAAKYILLGRRRNAPYGDVEKKSSEINVGLGQSIYNKEVFVVFIYFTITLNINPAESYGIFGIQSLRLGCNPIL